jgi:prepilin-type N-terminal cleavage/methylation domain-containing protein
MIDRSDRSARPDGGFTLLEILIVMSILGLILGALSAAFVVIVRTTPTAEVRVDDARSTRGLATWLSHDTTSAPPYDTFDAKGWIDTSAGPNDCGGAGANIVHFTWLEDGFTATTFVANYRYVAINGEGTVVRYSCSTSSGTTTQTLTAGLDPIDPPDVVLNKVGSDVVSVDFILHAAGGSDVLVETGSRNPVEFYP